MSEEDDAQEVFDASGALVWARVKPNTAAAYIRAVVQFDARVEAARQDAVSEGETPPTEEECFMALAQDAYVGMEDDGPLRATRAALIIQNEHFECCRATRGRRGRDSATIGAVLDAYKALSPPAPKPRAWAAERWVAALIKSVRKRHGQTRVLQGKKVKLPISRAMLDQMGVDARTLPGKHGWIFDAIHVLHASLLRSHHMPRLVAGCVWERKSDGVVELFTWAFKTEESFSETKWITVRDPTACDVLRARKAAAVARMEKFSDPGSDEAGAASRLFPEYNEGVLNSFLKNFAEKHGLVGFDVDVTCFRSGGCQHLESLGFSIREIERVGCWAPGSRTLDQRYRSMLPPHLRFLSEHAFGIHHALKGPAPRGDRRTRKNFNPLSELPRPAVREPTTPAVLVSPERLAAWREDEKRRRKETGGNSV